MAALDLDNPFLSQKVGSTFDLMLSLAEQRNKRFSFHSFPRIPVLGELFRRDVISYQKQIDRSS